MMVGTFKGSDYTIEIKYHLGKANVVANALSRKPKGMVASMLTTNKSLKEVGCLANRNYPT